jgi:amino acid permease
VDELHNPTPRRIACVSYSATAVCVILYLVVGVFGYLRFGDTTATNILLNYQDDLTLVETVLFSTGKLGMAGSMMVSYPLLLFPCRLCLHTLVGMLPGAVEHALLKMCGCELPRCLKSCEVSGQVWFYGETFIIIFGTYVVSVLVPNIVKVFGLTGALTGSFVVFIMPAAFSLQLLPGKCCDLAKLPTWGLLLFGVAFMVVSLTFITIGMVQDAAAAAGGGGAAGGGNGTVPGRHNATNGSAWFI